MAAQQSSVPMVQMLSVKTTVSPEKVVKAVLRCVRPGKLQVFVFRICCEQRLQLSTAHSSTCVLWQRSSFGVRREATQHQVCPREGLMVLLNLLPADLRIALHWGSLSSH